MEELEFVCGWCGSQAEPSAETWRSPYCIDCGEPLEREPDRSYHEVTISFVLPCATGSDPSDAIDRVHASSIYEVITGDWDGAFFQWRARVRAAPSRIPSASVAGRRRAEAGELLAQVLLVLRGEDVMTEELKGAIEAYLGPAVIAGLAT